jgi:hypothetical protein
VAPVIRAIDKVLNPLADALASVNSGVAGSDRITRQRSTRSPGAYWSFRILASAKGKAGDLKCCDARGILIPQLHVLVVFKSLF